MPLQWRTDTERNYAASECGRFSITIGGPMHKDGKRTWFYLAFAKSMVVDQEFNEWGVIKQAKSMEEAQKACAQHAIHVYRDTA